MPLCSAKILTKYGSDRHIACHRKAKREFPGGLPRKKSHKLQDNLRNVKALQPNFATVTLFIDYLPNCRPIILNL